MPSTRPDPTPRAPHGAASSRPCRLASAPSSAPVASPRASCRGPTSCTPCSGRPRAVATDPFPTSAPQPPDGRPMIPYAPSDPTAAADPYPLYEALRDDEPVFFAPGTQTYVLSRYDDVSWALNETEALSSDAMRGVLLGHPTGTGMETLPRADAIGNLVSVDPPDHSALRRIVNRGFTPKRMAEWHDRIEATVRELLAKVEGDPTFDVVSAVAAPLPVRMITELVGARPEDADNFRTWADAMTSVMSGSARVTGPGPEAMVAMLMLADDLGKRIDERQADPRDDLLTTLVRAQGDDVLS